MGSSFSLNFRGELGLELGAAGVIVLGTVLLEPPRGGDKVRPREGEALPLEGEDVRLSCRGAGTGGAGVCEAEDRMDCDKLALDLIDDVMAFGTGVGAGRTRGEGRGTLSAVLGAGAGCGGAPGATLGLGGVFLPGAGGVNRPELALATLAMVVDRSRDVAGVVRPESQAGRL